MEKSTMQLRKILENTDLTKTQRHKATELHRNVCRARDDTIGFTISFYPQGSFATKTAIRPYQNVRDQAYDVDVICEVNVPKESVYSDTLRGYFRDAL